LRDIGLSISTTVVGVRSWEREGGTLMRWRVSLCVGALAGLLFVLLPYAPAWALGGGNLDPSFGLEGRVLTNFGDTVRSLDAAYALAVQSDGKIVAAGFS
jgi:hypothetical protein